MSEILDSQRLEFSLQGLFIEVGEATRGKTTDIHTYLNFVSQKKGWSPMGKAHGTSMKYPPAPVGGEILRYVSPGLRRGIRQ